jgi:hypothetical protein
VDSTEVSFPVRGAIARFRAPMTRAIPSVDQLALIRETISPL